MKQWAEVDLPPGQFLGSTGVQTLTPAELGTGFQAWAKKVSYCAEFCARWQYHFISLLSIAYIFPSFLAHAPLLFYFLS